MLRLQPQVARCVHCPHIALRPRQGQDCPRPPHPISLMQDSWGQAVVWEGKRYGRGSGEESPSGCVSENKAGIPEGAASAKARSSAPACQGLGKAGLGTGVPFLTVT